MRDQHQRRAQLFIQLKHQGHDFFARGKVKATSGLVGQQHGWLYDESPGQCHALLLAAGQHLGVVPKPLAQTNALEHLRRLGPGIGCTCKLQRQHDVFQRREVAHQLKALEHKTDFLRTQRRPVVFAYGKEVLPCEVHRTAGGRIKPGDDGQQRAFARARRTDNGRCFARLQGKINIAQNGQCAGRVGH